MFNFDGQVCTLNEDAPLTKYLRGTIHILPPSIGGEPSEIGGDTWAHCPYASEIVWVSGRTHPPKISSYVRTWADGT